MSDVALYTLNYNATVNNLSKPCLHLLQLGGTGRCLKRDRDSSDTACLLFRQPAFLLFSFTLGQLIVLNLHGAMLALVVWQQNTKLFSFTKKMNADARLSFFEYQEMQGERPPLLSQLSRIAHLKSAFCVT